MYTTIPSASSHVHKCTCTQVYTISHVYKYTNPVTHNQVHNLVQIFITTFMSTLQQPRIRTFHPYMRNSQFTTGYLKRPVTVAELFQQWDDALSTGRGGVVS